MITDRGDIRQAIDCCSKYLGFTGAGGQFEHKADSLIANGRSGEWSE